MHEIKDLIATLCQSNTNAAQLITLFAHRMQTIHGECGIALLSTTKLKTNQCQITAFIDQQGKSIFNNDKQNDAVDEAPVYDGALVQDIISFKEPKLLHNVKSPFITLFGEFFDKHLNIASFPLFLQGGRVEKWILILFNRPIPLNNTDIERIWLVATLAINYGFSEENANKLRAANQWIENELNDLARIQNLLLPQDLSNTPGLKVAARLKPYAQVGGDYYDVSQLTSLFHDEQSRPTQDDWGFMIADASGHGSAAAIEIAMFDAILRTYRPDLETGPAGVFNYVNRYLFTRTIRGGFITAFVSGYFPEENMLTFCNAGHPAPFLKKIGGKIQNANNSKLIRLDESMSIPLGVIPDGEWTNATIDFEPNDILVLFTDGVTEAKSKSGDMFGEDRLEEIILQSKNEPSIILNNIEEALAQHQQGTNQSDDQTLLVVQPI